MNPGSQFELIDIHTHVNFRAFAEDGDAVVTRAREEKIGMILVGSQHSTSARAITYAEKYPSGVWAAVGLHPIHLVDVEVDADELGGGDAQGFHTRKEEFSFDIYRALGSHPKVVAIGECGLDYYRFADDPEIRKAQHETFAKHVALARELKKPLMVHCRNAYEDLLGLLKSEKADEVGGDIHFFAGDLRVAKKFLDFGFHLSFTGVITFASQYDDVIKNVPMERIMIETDAPYVAPVPYRGKRNEPRYVRAVAQRIAELRGVSFDEVARVTTENAERLFRLA